MKSTLLILTFITIATACSIHTAADNPVAKKTENNSGVDTTTITINEVEKDTTDFLNLINTLSQVNLPYTDSINFDNYPALKQFSKTQNNILQLDTITNYIGYGANYAPICKLNGFKNHYAIIIAIESENELKTVLITYNLKGKLISFLEVGYDEIAEGWSVMTSSITDFSIITTFVLWLDVKKVSISEYTIAPNGEIKLNLDRLRSEIRTNQMIKLGHKFIDTLIYENFNDDGDYRYINCKTQHNSNVSLIYNWDFEDSKPYSFSKGDTLQITWSIDTIYIAGDDNRIEYKEWALDAESIKSF